MPTLMELLTLNENYASKSGRGIGTDKEYNHNYITSFYEEHFKCYQDQAINLLEIGTGHGGSLILWNDYFPSGNIYGVDVNDYVNPIIDSYPRIKRYHGNGYDKAFADSLPGFDIVIDDGPHTLDSFIQCVDIFLPKVKKGGMLVIEDIPEIEHTEVLKNKIGTLPYKVVDTREQYGRFDNIMFIVFK